MAGFRKNFEDEVIVKAIHEAVKYNARHMGYIETVLMDWKCLGIRTMEDLMERNKKPDVVKDCTTANADAYKYID